MLMRIYVLKVIQRSRKIYQKRVLERNQSQESMIGYRNKVCYHSNRDHIQYTCNKLKKDLQKLKLLKKMKQPTMKVSDRDKLKGKNKEVTIVKDRRRTMQPSLHLVSLVLPLVLCFGWCCASILLLLFYFSQSID